MEEKIGDLRRQGTGGTKGPSTPLYMITGPVTVGRDAARCQLVLDDNTQKGGVSRVHCRFDRESDQRFYVTDLGSSNGTFVEGRKLAAQERAELRSGAVIKIGFMPPLVFHIRAHETPGADRELDGQSVLTLMDRLPEREVELAEPDRLRWLVDVGHAAATAKDPWDLLDISVERLLEVFKQASSAIIVLYDLHGNLTTPLAPIAAGSHSERLDQRKTAVAKGRFRRGARPENHQLQLSETVIKRVKEAGKSVLFSLKVPTTDDTEEASKSLSTYLERPPSVKQEVKSLMCVPLLAGEYNLGFIQVETETRARVFEKNDLHMLSNLAQQIALLLRNSELTYKEAIAAATRETLSRYLSPLIAERVIRGELKAELVGSMQTGTIFYSDIVGFTRMSGSMSPSNVVKLLNRYFKCMQEIVFMRGGCVDKCAGDQIMAYWGILENEAQFTARAVSAGLEMQIRMFEFNRDERLRDEISLPPEGLDHGIGLNTGMVCAGNVGGEHKIEFTVIGDTVNRAARIEGIAGRGQVFVGEATYEEIKARALCIRLPDCHAKNVAGAMKIYSVRGIVIPPQAHAAAESVESPEHITLENMTLSLPCTVIAGASGALTAKGLVTGIAPGAQAGASLVVQLNQTLELGAHVVLKWNIAEKAFPDVAAEVQRSDPLPELKAASVIRTGGAPLSAMKTMAPPLNGACVHGSMAHPGMHILSCAALPPELQAWKPGALLESDYKSEADILRQ